MTTWDFMASAPTALDAIAGSLSANTDIHSEDSQVRVVLDTWNLNVLRDSKANVPSVINSAFWNPEICHIKCPFGKVYRSITPQCDFTAHGFSLS
jgi:hypothetical protein